MRKQFDFELSFILPFLFRGFLSFNFYIKIGGAYP